MKLCYTFILCFTAACGGITQKGNEPLAPPLPPLCVPVKLSSGNIHPITISWLALKNTNVPVSGTIAGTSKEQLNVDGLKGARFEMTFMPGSIVSGNELQDSRIATYFFNVGIYSEATYRPSIDWVEGDNNVMPKPGESRRIRMTGPLAIAGQIVTVRVNAVVINNASSIVIQGDGANAVNVKATTLLQQNVAELLRQADVLSMESNVGINGQLVLERTCP